MVANRNGGMQLFLPTHFVPKWRRSKTNVELIYSIHHKSSLSSSILSKLEEVMLCYANDPVWPVHQAYSLHKQHKHIPCLGLGAQVVGATVRDGPGAQQTCCNMVYV